MPLRRLAAIAIFAALPFAAVKPILLRLPFIDRSDLNRSMTVYPDGAWWPDYPAFLAAVRKATRRGDTIAIVVPGMQWDNGYSYAYYRASYLLEGREVLPLVDRQDHRIAENFARAKYVAAWKVRVSGGGRPVLATRSGVLMVR